MMVEDVKKIPRVINYCWFGGNKKSALIERCINSWKKYCPDYKIIEWNEDNFNVRYNKYVKEAYDNKKWAFLTDYVRLWVLYNNGGIYLDTDVELISSLDSLLEYDCFLATEDNSIINTGLGCGATAHNVWIKVIMDDYNQCHFQKSDGSLDLTPCTTRNTIALEKYIHMSINSIINTPLGNSIILSRDFFCPFDFATGEMKKSTNTVGIHWFDASWRDSSINLREKMLRPVKRIIGKERFAAIKKFLKES